MKVLLVLAGVVIIAIYGKGQELKETEKAELEPALSDVSSRSRRSQSKATDGLSDGKEVGKESSRLDRKKRALGFPLIKRALEEEEARRFVGLMTPYESQGEDEEEKRAPVMDWEKRYAGWRGEGLGARKRYAGWRGEGLGAKRYAGWRGDGLGEKRVPGWGASSRRWGEKKR